MPKNINIGTYTVGVGSFVITKEDGVRIIAIKLLAGAAGTITGQAKIGALGVSNAIALVIGEPTLVSNQDPIDGLTVNITAGQATIITNQ